MGLGRAEEKKIRVLYAYNEDCRWDSKAIRGKGQSNAWDCSRKKDGVGVHENPKLITFV
jgi:hypothetical protein